MTLLLAAALWGFAEATLFFIVPDVLLTFIALGNRRAALRACAAAVAGALAGGTLMYLWGGHDLAGATAALDRVPAIGPVMIGEVRASLERAGAGALFLGPLTGTPYKIYAVMSGGMGLGLTQMLLVSVPARGLRFLLVSLVTAWLSRVPLGSWSAGRKRRVLLGFWLVFYVGYLTSRGG